MIMAWVSKISHMNIPNKFIFVWGYFWERGQWPIKGTPNDFLLKICFVPSRNMVLLSCRGVASFFSCKLSLGFLLFVFHHGCQVKDLKFKDRVLYVKSFVQESTVPLHDSHLLWWASQCHQHYSLNIYESTEFRENYTLLGFMFSLLKTENYKIKSINKVILSCYV